MANTREEAFDNLWRQLSRPNLLITYELGSIPVTTNFPFDEWDRGLRLGKTHWCAAGRLTHHVHTLEMNGNSYRLRHSWENALLQASEEPDDARLSP